MGETRAAVRPRGTTPRADSKDEIDDGGARPRPPRGLRQLWEWVRLNILRARRDALRRGMGPALEAAAKRGSAGTAARPAEDSAEADLTVEPRGARLRRDDGRTGKVRSLMQPVRDGLGQVPPLPHVVRELLKELSDPASTARSVARIATSDPALAASLIRTVNSAAMGLRRKVTSVADAVSYLGYSIVRSLVIRMRLEQVLPTRGGQAGYDAEDLWVHSLAVSHAADCLAEKMGGVDRGFVSTLGLLHDIGKLAINSQFPDSAALLRVRHPDFPDESFLDRERRVLGADHAEVGAILARHWKLPEELVEAIRWHHAPLSMPAGLARPVYEATALVHLANQLAKYCYVYGEDMEIDIVKDELFAELGLCGPVTRLLSAKMRMAISRAIFFADESTARPLGSVRRFVRLCGPQEGRALLDLPSPRGKSDPRVGITEGTADPLFASRCPAINCNLRRASSGGPGGPGAQGPDPVLRSAPRVRFKADATPAGVESLVAAVTAHQEALGLSDDVRLPARFLVRRLVPNLVEIMNEAGPAPLPLVPAKGLRPRREGATGPAGGAERIEVAQSLDGGRYALAIRCPALSFDRRFGPGATPRAARRVLERELANVLNLRWFPEIFASLDGQTLLFLSHAGRRAASSAAA